MLLNGCPGSLGAAGSSNIAQELHSVIGTEPGEAFGSASSVDIVVNEREGSVPLIGARLLNCHLILSQISCRRYVFMAITAPGAQNCIDATQVSLHLAVEIQVV